MLVRINFLEIIGCQACTYYDNRKY